MTTRTIEKNGVKYIVEEGDGRTSPNPFSYPLLERKKKLNSHLRFEELVLSGFSRTFRSGPNLNLSFFEDELSSVCCLFSLFFSKENFVNILFGFFLINSIAFCKKSNKAKAAFCNNKAAQNNYLTEIYFNSASS